MRSGVSLLLLLCLTAGAHVNAQTGQQERTSGVLHFDVNLVQMDAVVTDRKGRHVAGLKAEDFSVLQDGKLQTITHFEYVSRAGNTRGSEARQSVVFVLDDSIISFSDFVTAKKALYSWVNEALRGGVTAALVRTSSNSGTLQQFSSDPTFLRLALDHMSWRPPNSTPIRPFPWLYASIQSLAGFPGRKSVIWISPGLPVGANLDLLERLRRLADEANRASVTVQTIDVRGLPAMVTNSVVTDASQAKPGDLNPIARGFDLSFPGSDYFRSQNALAVAADWTGGLFQHDSNNLMGQLQTAISDGDGYYLLGWNPGPDAFKGKAGHPIAYHDVRIKVKEKSLLVRSRSGYYAVPGENGGAAEHFGSEAQMQDALFSPLRKREINMQVAAAFALTDHLQPYIHSWIQLGPEGIELRPSGKQGCSVASVELAAAPLLLSWNSYGNPRIQWQRTSAEICGHALAQAQTYGLVAEVRTPIAASGPYQVRVAVRNLASNESAGSRPDDGFVRRDSMTPTHDQTGSADELIEVPDWHKDNSVISGLTVGKTSPSAGGDSPEGVTVRVGSETDAAIRRFHSGDSISYQFKLIGREGTAMARLHLSHDAKDVDTSEPFSVALEQPFERTQLLSTSLKPGHYSLSIEATEGKGHRKLTAP